MFFAGANSIFNGDKLLTTPNPEFDADTVRKKESGLVGSNGEGGWVHDAALPSLPNFHM